VRAIADLDDVPIKCIKGQMVFLKDVGRPRARTRMNYRDSQSAPGQPITEKIRE
jgi:hypothetical protein